MTVNTPASKRSELIGNAAIVWKRRVIHKKSTCVCRRLPVAARNARSTCGRLNNESDHWLRKTMVTVAAPYIGIYNPAFLSEVIRSIHCINKVPWCSRRRWLRRCCLKRCRLWRRWRGRRRRSHCATVAVRAVFHDPGMTEDLCDRQTPRRIVLQQLRGQTQKPVTLAVQQTRYKTAD